jgi:hypothetical protein
MAFRAAGRPPISQSLPPRFPSKLNFEDGGRLDHAKEMEILRFVISSEEYYQGLLILYLSLSVVI